MTCRTLLAVTVLLLAGCASELQTSSSAGPRMVLQNLALNPANGGWAVGADALQPGDIILSSADGISSIGVRLLTLSPVSHASFYIGEGEVAEAVGHGIQTNDRFFCSQFVLEAYRRAGLPLTDADSRLLSPADLLHMREGDVPSVRAHQALQYVGHLKFRPVAAVASSQ